MSGTRLLRVLLGKVRAFRMLFVLLLILGILTNGVMVEACFCGAACLHGLQDKGETRVSSPFHNRCSGIDCKGCNLERGRTLKATNSCTPNCHGKLIDVTPIMSILTDSHSDSPVFNGIGSGIHVFVKRQPPPAYLKNLSLLF